MTIIQNVAYMDQRDRRVYVPAAIYSGKRKMLEDVSFLVDGGAEHSGLDIGTASNKGFKFEGVIEIGTAGDKEEFIVISGVKIEFAVTERNGLISSVDCNLPVLILSRNIIGSDVLTDIGVELRSNYKTMSASLEKQS